MNKPEKTRLAPKFTGLGSSPLRTRHYGSTRLNPAYHGPRLLPKMVTVHESRVTSVQKRMEPRRSLLGASVDVTEARNDQAGRQTHRWSVFRSLITGQSVSSNSSPPESISSLRLRTTDNLKKRRATKLHSTASCDHQIECVPHFTHVCLSAYPTPGAIQPGACRFALAGCARLLSP